MSNQRGGIVTGWLIKVVISLLVLGLVVFEAGAIIVARVGVDGTADTAARDAASSYGTTHNQDQAKAEASKDATEGGGVLTAFSISQDGKTVSVTIERTAHTFIIQHIGPLKKWRLSRSTHTASVG